MGNTLRVVALGRGITLELDDSLDASTIELMRVAWRDADGPALAEGPSRKVAQRDSADDAITAPDARSLISNVSVGVTLAALEANRGTMLMLHACGIATDGGEVLAFVGPSGRGKTTAARALGEHYGYVSDETVAVAADRAVLPYRKPLSIIPTETNAPKQQIAPSQLGLRPLPSVPLRLAALVLLDRDPDARDAPMIEPVPMVEAIVELVPQLSYLTEMASPLQRLSSLIDATGGVRRVRYRDSAVLPEIVDRLLETTSPQEGAAPVGPLPDGITDAVAIGETTLVLADSTVSVLAGIGSIVWREAILGVNQDQIAAHAVSVYGEPPGGDAHALVGEALAELAANGLLRSTA